MILINLLPHREEARKRRKEAFFLSLAVAALLGGLISGGVYAAYQAQINQQQGRNSFLAAENKKLDAQIAEIATLQKDIDGLKARQEAVESLQADRNLPVHLLNELVTRLPDGIYITSMREDNRRVTIQGVAQSNERVSELLRNLGSDSYWLSRPELVEIVAGSTALPNNQQRRVANFTMRLTLLSSSESQKMRAAASATAGVPVAAASAPAKKQ